MTQILCLKDFFTRNDYLSLQGVTAVRGAKMSENKEITEIKLSDELVESDADITFSFESRGAIGTLT